MNSHEMLAVINRLAQLNLIAIRARGDCHAYFPDRSEKGKTDVEIVFSRLQDLHDVLSQIVDPSLKEKQEEFDEEVRMLFADSFAPSQYLSPYKDVGVNPIPEGAKWMKEFLVDLSEVVTKQDMIEFVLATYPYEDGEAPYLLVMDPDSLVFSHILPVYANCSIEGTDVTSVDITEHIPGILQVWWNHTPAQVLSEGTESE